MKIELQAGDTITIPKGCKAVIKYGCVVFEKEEKKQVQEFKDGDVLTSIFNGQNVIFKEMEKCGTFAVYYNDLGSINYGWIIDSFRHATEEEKQLLFDKMKEQGLKWNAEEKRVEKIRWRAKRGEYYFLFRSTTLKVDCYTECFDEIDANLYHSDNYFRTNEQAEEAAKRVKEVLHKYHEEIGE